MLVEFFAVVGDGRAGAAQRESWAAPRRAGRFPAAPPGLRPGCAPSCPRQTSRPIFSMACLNCSRFFGLGDHVGAAPIISTPYFSSTPCWARSIARLRPVWPPSVGSNASGRSASITLATISQVERLDVGAVGHVRVGHDRGRIRIDQHDLVAFFAQGLAGLRARIIELAGLANDDRAGADEQNLVNVVAARHGSFFPSSSPGQSRLWTLAAVDANRARGRRRPSPRESALCGPLPE